MLTFDVISNFVQFWSKKVIHLAYTSVGHVETMKYMLSSHLTNTDQKKNVTWDFSLNYV